MSWIPFKIVKGSGLLQWLFIGEAPCNEPFFEDFIRKFRSQGRPSLEVLTSPECLLEIAQALPEAHPEAIIFHISRCGSTLLAQMLASSPANTVLPEVPLFDELIRLGRADLLQACLRLHARPGTRLFVKMDSWHLFSLRFLRGVFPNTPFVITYRNPWEVLLSHQKRRGMHMVPELAPHPAFQGIFQEGMLFDEYAAKVLEKYFDVILQWNDGQSCLLPYSSGSAMLQGFQQATGCVFSEEEKKAMEARTRFDAKAPDQPFRPPTVPKEMPDFLQGAMQRYEQLTNA